MSNDRKLGCRRRTNRTNRLRHVAAVTAACVAALAVETSMADEPRGGQTAPSTDRLSSVFTGPEELDPIGYYRLSQRAAELTAKRKYAQAAAAYRRLVAYSPDDPSHWSELGKCLQKLKKYREAVEPLTRAFEMGAGMGPRDAIQVARMHAKLGEPLEAFRWLEIALADRLENRRDLAIDANFKTIRDEPRFQAMLGRLPEDPKDRDAGWQADLAFLASEAERMRPLLEEDFPAAQRAAMVADIAERIGTLSDAEITIELQKFVARFRDGHSHVRFYEADRGLARVPLGFYWFSDGLFVIEAGKEYESYVGWQVVAVGSMPIDEVYEALKQTTSRDNPTGIRSGGAWQLTFPDVVAGIGCVDDASDINYTLQSPEGSREVVRPTSASFQRKGLAAWRSDNGGQPPRYLQRGEEAHWFEPLDPSTLYVQFSSVRDTREQSIVEFAAKLQGEIDAGDYHNLIIDARMNGGGNTYLNVPLLRTLIHFETTTPGGTLYAITSRHTFSAAQNFVTDVDRMTNAVFVGEPTGSRPNSIGESTRVVLPYSKLVVGISTRVWQHSYPRDRRIWIAPELPAPLSSEDYFAGRDPSLEAVLALIAEQE